jgi:AcrR family transcriptional regulator
MKRRKQTDESKQMIADALLRLVRDHELSSITISQLAAEARVSRNTVYRNFGDMDEVLLFVLRSFMKRIATEASVPGKPTGRDLLLWRFTILRKSPQLRAFLTDVRRAYLMREFDKANMDLFRLPRAELEGYDRSFFIGGIDAITVAWIEGGMKESPEEMVALVAELVRKRRPDSSPP